MDTPLTPLADAVGTVIMVITFCLGPFVLLGLYFLPTIIAVRKAKRNSPAIAMLNLFLGWTFIGWVLSLVWAATDDPREK